MSVLGRSMSGPVTTRITCVADHVPVLRAPMARARYAAFVMVPPAWLSTITGVRTS